MVLKPVSCEKCHLIIDNSFESVKSIESVDSETKKFTCSECGHVQMFKPVKGEYLSGGRYRYLNFAVSE